MAEVSGQPLVAERAALECDLPYWKELRLFHNAVNYSAPAAAPERKRVRSFHRFHTLDVVQVTIVLNIVSDAIDVEVRRRGISADDGRVAVPLALSHRDARDVADHVRHVLHAL